MRNKGCVCVRAPMEEKHEAWTMRHSCNLPRGRTGRFLVSKFFFGLCSVEDRANGSSVSISIYGL